LKVLQHVAGEMMMVQQSGLYLMPEKAYLSTWSDGQVIYTSIDTCFIGYLDIKCLYSVNICVTIEMLATEIADKYVDNLYLSLFK